MRGNATDDCGCGYNMYRIVNVCNISGSGGRKNRHRKKRRGGIDDQALSSFRVELLRKESECFAGVECFIRSKSRLFLERFVDSGHFVGIGSRVAFLLRSLVNYVHKIKPSCKIVPDL